ncbi:hypothetical protein [Providencia sp. Me31A]|uniref:hypothetical protein n=1 Tax=Providencia sp. Me31A TaxID=3392637 RepID=UPI003D288C20
MLHQIIKLKAHKERRLRQQVVQGQQQYEKQRFQQANLFQKREVQKNEWDALKQETFTNLSKNDLSRLQKNLKAYYLKDNRLKNEILAIENQCDSWLEEKKELLQELRNLRIKQEKLNWIISEE